MGRRRHLPVSVWVPGAALRSQQAGQLVVRHHHLVITSRPAVISRLRGFHWTVPTAGLTYTIRFRPHEAAIKTPWVSFAADDYDKWPAICLRMVDFEQLTAALSAAGIHQDDSAEQPNPPEPFLSR